MWNKNSTLLFILCFMQSLCLYGQNKSNPSPDTLVVYETIVIYDTVYVHDTVKIESNNTVNMYGFIEPKQPEIRILQFDSIHNSANILLISGKNTATFPVNSIMYVENLKNSNNMKKISFIGLMLFAFQNMVISQTGFGISAGGGTWWANCNKPVSDRQLSPVFNIGFYLKAPITDHLNFWIEPGYYYLMNNYSYKAFATNIEWEDPDYFFYNPNDSIQSYTHVVGDEESASDYHQFSLPAKISYSLGKFEPWLGFEYSYRFSESWLNKNMSSYGITTGLYYILTNQIGIGLNYFYGISKDFEYTGHTINSGTRQIISTDKYNWKSSRIGLSINYTFKSNSQKD